MATREELLKGLGMSDEFINRPNPFTRSLDLRPNIGPGTTTITGDPNNPFGGQVTDQNMNMFNPDESPEEAAVRLFRSGLSVDQISQMTGLMPDQVAMVLGPRAYEQPNPTAELGFPDPNSSKTYRETFLPESPPQGIESLAMDDLATDTNTPELDDFIDRGNSITDLVTSQLDIPAPSLEQYLNEAQTVDTLDSFGLDLDEADADALDEENSLSKKVDTL